MNICIPLSSIPSRNKDIELKFALRCLPKHDNVYIIGRNPHLPNIIHVPFTDTPGIKNKSQNIYNKILLAFTMMDEMYFHADDHFISKNFHYQYYYDGTLEDKLTPQTSEDYKRTIKNTITFLRERKLSTKFFNVHCPVYYEKELFPIIWDWPDYGYCIKTLYCNVNRIEGVSCSDMKIKKHLPENKLKAMLQERTFFSSQDEYFTSSFFSFLSSLYPLPSRYE